MARGPEGQKRKIGGAYFGGVLHSTHLQRFHEIELYILQRKRKRVLRLPDHSQTSRWLQNFVHYIWNVLMKIASAKN